MYTGADRKLIRARFDRLERLIRRISIQEHMEMAAIHDVVDKVNAQTTVIDGVTALLDGLHTQLADVKAQLAAGDPAAAEAALETVVAGIQANTDKLAAAVARDTDANDEVHASGM